MKRLFTVMLVLLMTSMASTSQAGMVFHGHGHCHGHHHGHGHCHRFR